MDRSVFTLKASETKSWPIQYIRLSEWMIFVEKYGEELARAMKIAPDSECQYNPFEKEYQEWLNIFKEAANRPERRFIPRVITVTDKEPVKKLNKREKAFKEAGIIEQNLFDF